MCIFAHLHVSKYILLKASRFLSKTGQAASHTLTDADRGRLAAVLKPLASPDSPLDKEHINAFLRRLQDEPAIANQVPLELANYVTSVETYLDYIKAFLANKPSNGYPAIPKEIQQFLNTLGYPRKLTPDGILGPETKAALEWFKDKHNIANDATDSATITAIRSAYNARNV